MNYERVLVCEALKRFIDGRFVEMTTEGYYHIWNLIPHEAHIKGEDTDKVRWEVDIIGALFMMHMKNSGFIEEDDCSGNWWTNELIERKINELKPFSSNTNTLFRLNAIYKFYSPYSLAGPDMEFRDKCISKTKFLLTSFLKTGLLGITGWGKS